MAHLVTDSTLTSRPVSSLLSRLWPIKVGTVIHPQAAFMSGGRCFEVAATNQIGVCHQPTPLSAPRHCFMPQPTNLPSSCARSRGSSGRDVFIRSASIWGNHLEILSTLFLLRCYRYAYSVSMEYIACRFVLNIHTMFRTNMSILTRYSCIQVEMSWRLFRATRFLSAIN